MVFVNFVLTFVKIELMPMNLNSTTITPSYTSHVIIFKRNESNFSSALQAQPELKLVYIEEGTGKRIIGNSIDQFTGGELTLIGPNLSHVWINNKSEQPNKSQKSKTLIAGINPKIFGESFFEMKETNAIHTLIERSKFGIEIKGATKEKVVLKMHYLLTTDGFEKITGILDILHIISLSTETSYINKPGNLHTKPASGRLANIFHYIDLNIDKAICLKEVAKMANLAPESFCRYFKQKTGKTFVDYLQETRIRRASKMLLHTDFTSAEIAYQTGFKTASGFNKLFKKQTGQCPTEYRKKGEEREMG